MRRAIMAAVPLALVGLLVWLLPRERNILEDAIGDFSAWRPRVEEIDQDLRARPGQSERQRMDRFAELFTLRFREKHLAVKVEVARPDRLNVLCAASIPWWDTARIAAAATSEAERLFGRPFGADIFESYISRPRVKVAELTPGRPRAHVVFDPSFDAPRARRRPRSRSTGTFTPSMLRSIGGSML